MSQASLDIKISRRFFFTLTLLGIFSVISFIAFFSTVKKFENDAPIVKQLAKQKLTVEIISAYLLSIPFSDTLDANEVSAKFEAIISDIETSHNYLTLDPRVAREFLVPSIRHYYFEKPNHLNRIINNYISQCQQLLSNPFNKENIHTTIENGKIISGHLDQIMILFREENDKEITHLKRNEFILFIATIILLFIIWKMVFNPARKELKLNMSKLIRKDNDLMEANIQLEKKVEERTREIHSKDKMYRLLIEKMNEGLAYYTFEGKFSFVNDKFCEILGYKRDELIDQTIFKIIFPEDISLVEEKIKNRRKGIGEKYEFALRSKTDKKIWVYVSSTVITQENEVSGVMVVITDITEKKETGLQLEELNKFNETLIHTIPLGMQIVDPEGTVLYANHMIKNIAGCDTVGKKCWTIIHDTKVPCQGCLRALGCEAGNYNVCEAQEVFNGKTVHIYQSGIQYHHTHAVLEIFADITDLKETQQKLREKNKEFQTFISRASHDMRSPVANILGLTSLLKKNTVSAEQQTVSYIEQSANTMDKILLDLINIGKVYNDILHISRLDVEKIMNDLCSDQRVKNKLQHIRYETKKKVSKNFYSDESLIKSILNYLLDNAILYRKPASNDAFISVEVDDTQHGVQIVFSDNGQGMTPEVQERACEMFFKGNLSSTGNGLGLYMVKTYAEKLGGTIKIHSSVESGTNIILHLPDLRASA